MTYVLMGAAGFLVGLAVESRRTFFICLVAVWMAYISGLLAAGGLS